MYIEVSLASVNILKSEMQAISLNSASNSISCTAFLYCHAPRFQPMKHLSQFSELKFTSTPSVTRYKKKLIGDLVRSCRVDLLRQSLIVNNYSIMQYSFVTHTRYNVVKNNYSINLAKNRIKTEYGRIT